MSFFQVNSGEIRNSSEQLELLLQKFRTEKENLVGTEQNLKTMWEGEANEMFHKAFMMDAGQMDAFCEVIGSYARVMMTIADRYDSAEARNAGIASNRLY